MSASATPSPSKSSRKRLLGIAVVTIVVLALLIPPLFYGGFMVPVARVTFRETTGSLSADTTANATVVMQMAYEYMLTRMGGRVRTADTGVSASKGTANITISLRLTNPSNQAIDLGNVNISGAAGTRDHTIILGVDEGVRLPGSYTLDIVITASVMVGSVIDLNLTTMSQARFNVP